MKNHNAEMEKLKQWLRAIEIAKILFMDAGYHTRYLEEVARFLREVLTYDFIKR